jgi:hypothetical protein
MQCKKTTHTKIQQQFNYYVIHTAELLKYATMNYHHQPIERTTAAASVLDDVVRPIAVCMYYIYTTGLKFRYRVVALLEQNQPRDKCVEEEHWEHGQSPPLLLHHVVHKNSRRCIGKNRMNQQDSHKILPYVMKDTSRAPNESDSHNN